MASPSRVAGALAGRARHGSTADHRTFARGAAVALLPGCLVLGFGAVAEMRVGTVPWTLLMSLWVGLGGVSTASVWIVRGRGYSLACAGLSLFGLLGLVGAIWVSASAYRSSALATVLVASSGVLAFGGTLLLNARYSVRTLLPLTMAIVGGVATYQVTERAAFRKRLLVWVRTPERQLFPGAPAPSQGVSVVLYTDYQCPYSRGRAESFERVLAADGGAVARHVAFETRHFPLDAECNPIVKGRFHEAACEAAVAVRLATEHGHARELERWLYANAHRLDRRLIGSTARSIAGVSDYEERYDAALQDLRKEVSRAAALGVRGTPAVFVDGRVATGFVHDSEIGRLLDFARRRSYVADAVTR